MNIKQGDSAKVTLTYSHIENAIGTVVRVADTPDDLHLVRLADGTEVWLFKEEFELYTPLINLAKEKIETKIEEYKEDLPSGVMSFDARVAGIITGLQLALDILNEEE